MEAQLNKLVNILSRKFSTTFIIKSKKSEINFQLQNHLKLDPNFNYELALVYFSTFNSIFNINKNNNKIIVKVTDSKNKVLQKNLNLTPGAYEIVEISKVIENEFKYDKTLEPLKEKDYYIKIKPNPISLNCIMKISKGCSVKFPKEESALPREPSANSLAHLLGFEVEKEYKEGIHYSKPVNITDINRIMVTCNIIEGGYFNGERTNIIFDLPANTVKKGYRIIEKPKFPIYYPLISNNINEIKFKIIDENNKLIDFNGEEISFTVHLKQV